MAFDLCDYVAVLRSTEQVALPVARFGPFLVRRPSLAVLVIVLVASSLFCFRRFLSLSPFSPSRCLMLQQLFLQLARPAHIGRDRWFLSTHAYALSGFSLICVLLSRPLDLQLPTSASSTGPSSALHRFGRIACFHSSLSAAASGIDFPSIAIPLAAERRRGAGQRPRSCLVLFPSTCFEHLIAFRVSPPVFFDVCWRHFSIFVLIFANSDYGLASTRPIDSAFTLLPALQISALYAGVVRPEVHAMPRPRSKLS